MSAAQPRVSPGFAVRLLAPSAEGRCREHHPRSAAGRSSALLSAKVGGDGEGDRAGVRRLPAHLLLACGPRPARLSTVRGPTPSALESSPPQASPQPASLQGSRCPSLPDSVRCKNGGVPPCALETYRNMWKGSIFSGPKPCAPNFPRPDLTVDKSEKPRGGAGYRNPALSAII